MSQRKDIEGDREIQVDMIRSPWCTVHFKVTNIWKSLYREVVSASCVCLFHMCLQRHIDSRASLKWDGAAPPGAGVGVQGGGAFLLSPPNSCRFSMCDLSTEWLVLEWCEEISLRKREWGWAKGGDETLLVSEVNWVQPWVASCQSNSL